MRHLKSGKKLGRTSSHRKATMISMATALFEHKKIHTTEAKAKALRPFAEKIITRAKHALIKENQGLLPEGQTIDVHNRREVGKMIKNKAVLQELFDVIAPTLEGRNGGYTRIIKTGFRLGDAGSKALIELVDWSNPQEGPTSSKKKKKKSAPKPPVAQTVGEVKEEKLVDDAAEVDQTANVETKDEAVAETIADDSPQEAIKSEVAADETPEEIVESEDTVVDEKSEEDVVKAEDQTSEELNDESKKDDEDQEKKKDKSE